MESFLLPCVATGVSLRAVWCLSGATPGGSRGHLRWRSRRGQRAERAADDEQSPQSM